MKISKVKKNIMKNLADQADGLGWQIPNWLTEGFIDQVRERMRQLMGQWNSLPYGESMQLQWAESTKIPPQSRQ